MPPINTVTLIQARHLLGEIADALAQEDPAKQLEKISRVVGIPANQSIFALVVLMHTMSLRLEAQQVECREVSAQLAIEAGKLRELSEGIQQKQSLKAQFRAWWPFLLGALSCGFLAGALSALLLMPRPPALSPDQQTMARALQLMSSSSAPAIQALIDTGDIKAIADCSMPGWIRMEKSCLAFTRPGPDGAQVASGWRIRH
ncbi:hypothetical protein J2X48_004407 [Bosea sp. BE271]|jgi:hypothetical protein|nr:MULTISPECIES: hypothetical protein [Bosea]MDR6830517.1 hypothetical protein [Bosea robiniae]MDR6897398.1 hypothetical protein [Bosea sp. BE109]MDR7140795.1 hypothetical protein [Bosea sp. BE168]MDR7177461.1 hypothetical protein [Bosea sp. BE271]